MEYAEDRYNDLNEFEHTSNKTNLLKKTKILNRGYHTIKCSVLSKNKMFEMIEIGVYSSGSHGSQIRNAETGEYYKYKVGTLDEDLFFKVSCSSGNNNEVGPLTLFYDSSTQYENHQYLFVDDDVIKKWQIKKQNRLDYLEK
jgi:hypothetical protein